MKLVINEWRRSWRFLSVQIAAAAVAFGVMPPDMQAALLDALGVAPERVPAVFGLLFLIGRLLPQPKARQ